MTSRIQRTALGLFAVLATTLAVSAPAYAEVEQVHDGADASGSPSDILTMRAEHGDKRLKVRFTFADLLEHAERPAYMTIWLDTVKGTKGPEFGLATGLSSGMDYLLTPTEDWRSNGEPVNCTYRLVFRWQRDVVHGWLADDCLDKAGKVRVGARMVDPDDRSHPVVDWVEGPRNWTPWLSAG